MNHPTSATRRISSRGTSITSSTKRRVSSINANSTRRGGGGVSTRISSVESSSNKNKENDDTNNDPTTIKLSQSSPSNSNKSSTKTSPMLTRSASKKRKQRLLLGSRDLNTNKYGREKTTSNGGILVFSPPDLDQISQKEREADEDRTRRIEELKKTELLVFSPPKKKSKQEEQPAARRGASQELDKMFFLEFSPGGSKLKHHLSKKELVEENKFIKQKLDSVCNELLVLKQNYEEMVDSKKREMDNLEKLNESLTSQLKAKKRNSLTISDPKEIQALKEKFRLSEQKRKNIQLDLQKVQSQLAASKEAIENHLRHVGELQQQNEALRETVSQLKEFDLESKQILDEQQKAHTELYKKYEEVATENTIIQKQCEELQGSLDGYKLKLEEEVQEKSKELEKFKEVNEELQVLLKEQREEIRQLKSTSDQVSGMAAELRNTRSENSKIQQELDEYKGSLKEYKEKVLSLQISISDLEKEKDDLLQQKIDLSNQLEKEERENEEKVESIMKELEAADNEICEKVQEIEAHRQNHLGQVEHLEKCITDLNANKAALEQKSVANKLKLAAMEAQLDAARLDHDEAAKAEKQRHEHEVEDLLKQLRKAKEEYDANLSKALESSSKVHKEEINSLIDRQKHLERENSEITFKLENLEEVMEIKNESMSRLEREVEIFKVGEKKNNELEKKLTQLLDERDNAVGAYNDLKGEFQAMEEVRRSLHNKVMQLVGNIRVYVRVRPTIAGEDNNHNNTPFNFPHASNNTSRRPSSSSSSTSNSSSRSSHSTMSSSLSSHDLTKSVVEVLEPYKDRGGLAPRRKNWRFGFDGVFDPSKTQSDLWDATEPIVQSALDGYNICLFAYGQTGSGKTFTMLGTDECPGLLTRTVEMVFMAKRDFEAGGKNVVTLSVEMLEIYNEEIRDLLQKNNKKSGNNAVKLVGDKLENNIVFDVNSFDEVMYLISAAQKRRCVKATKSNAESSRSHFLFTMNFVVQSSTTGQLVRRSKINVCDLAGSERLSKSGATGSTMRETQHINTSLSALSNVIEKLQAKSQHIPYRDSKLTSLLRDSLGGDSKTLAIVCCNPLPEHFQESICTLRFAAKVNKVDLKAESSFNFS